MSFAAASCLVSGHADTPYSDTSGLPAPGEGRYFLVRAANVCGSGRYGSRNLDGPAIYAGGGRALRAPLSYFSASTEIARAEVCVTCTLSPTLTPSRFFRLRTR